MDTKTSAPTRFLSFSQVWNSGDAICRAGAIRCVTPPDRRSIRTTARRSSGSKLSRMYLDPALFCIVLSLFRGQDGLDAISVGLSVKAFQAKHLAYDSTAIAPFKMNQQVNCIADVRADSLVGQLNAGLQNAAGEP